MNEQTDSNGKMAERFRRIAKEQFEGYSPLYEQLALSITDDPEVLALAGGVEHGEQVAPLLLLGSVHYLLLKGTEHPLAAYYPSVAGYDRKPQEGDPYPAFREFVLQNRAEVERLVQTGIVQTNEVQRCACLLPVFGLLYKETLKRPLALVEVGTSAGLHLLWDKYGYSYGHDLQFGDDNSPVQLSCELRGKFRPPMPEPFPRVGYRVGVDLDPIDVRDPDQVLWLRAMIWPEHQDRAELLERAVAIAREDPPTLLKGDMFDLLPQAVRDAPRGTAICVYHSYTIVQQPKEARDRLTSLVGELSLDRPIYRISQEWLGGETAQITLMRYAGNTYEEQHLADCHPHGHWLEWKRG
ncbi:MAG: DUF2332 domain-containing protein [Chloroflexota bacterium]|nr:DUF2332 domain-containing protein [Chloroflexota bacterium]